MAAETEAWLRSRGLPIQLANSTIQRTSPKHDDLLSNLTNLEQREFKRHIDRLFHRSLDDCHGECALRQQELAEIVSDCLLFFNGERYDLDRFVVMPNHVHALVQFRSGESFKTISQSWMRYSARRMNELRGTNGAFWQPEAFDHLIRSVEQFEYLQRYIAENPARAKLEAGDFLYWERE